MRYPSANGTKRKMQLLKNIYYYLRGFVAENKDVQATCHPHPSLDRHCGSEKLSVSATIFLDCFDISDN